MPKRTRKRTRKRRIGESPFEAVETVLLANETLVRGAKGGDVYEMALAERQ